MQRLKKVLYFILGQIMIPLVCGAINALIFGHDCFKYFHMYFSVVYIICYLLFPILYCGKIIKWFSNKYVFYIIMYLIFEMFGIGLCFI